VLTGRHADPRVVEKADLVTEMREIKHYMKKGVKARTGIEM
jgi:cob(I)alamin adenosyltransferase